MGGRYTRGLMMVGKSIRTTLLIVAGLLSSQLGGADPPHLRGAEPAGGGPRCGGKRATIVGTGGDDVLLGTPRDDVIVGGGGKDLIRGRKGADTICGRAKRDRIFGGPGRDLLIGGSGSDRVDGGGGLDTLRGGRGRDVLTGGRGRDVLRGGPGADSCFLGGRRSVEGCSPVVVAAGDIACDPGDADFNRTRGRNGRCRMRATSNLIAGQNAGVVLTLGDNQYEDGQLWKFRESYDPTWGRFLGRTRPTAGNHEYRVEGAAGHFDYFGARAGPRGKGYYSLRVGRWHLVALNSNCGHVPCHEESAQTQWLVADLAADGSRCTLAYWHHPRFSSEVPGEFHEFWNALYRDRADVILNGHAHNYERFAPQRPDGSKAPRRGIRQIVVGTGGKDLRPFTQVAANSQVRDDRTYGVLYLALHPGSYTWLFADAGGRSYGDFGRGSCR